MQSKLVLALALAAISCLALTCWLQLSRRSDDGSSTDAAHAEGAAQELLNRSLPEHPWAYPNLEAALKAAEPVGRFWDQKLLRDAAATNSSAEQFQGLFRRLNRY